jgi:PAS domain S-box-containing protein
MRILHLEDNPLDVELVRALVRAEWPDCAITVAASREEYLAGLQPGAHDLILSDFTLIGFGGQEALRLARQTVPQTPFVFFSGTLGEENAIEALHQGAADYVLKENIKRLVTAIRRALREADERRHRVAAEAALRASEARLRAIIEAEPEWVQLFSADGHLLEMNHVGLRLLGVQSQAEALARPLADLVVPAYRPAFAELRERAIQGEDARLEYEIVSHDGTHRWLDTRVSPLREGGDQVSAFIGVTQDITARKQSEALLRGENEVLEMIAMGQPLDAILTALLRVIEAQSPDMLCSVLLVDPEGLRLRHGAAPSLPAAYNAALDGLLIGPGVGSCGAAIHRGAAVVTEDIATDPLWEDYRQPALAHGLRACWSTPIFDPRRRAVGSFAVYTRQPARPTPRHDELILLATQTAAIALNHHQAVHRVGELHDLLDRARDAIIVTDLERRVTSWNRGAERLSGWPAAEAEGRPLEELLGREAMSKLAGCCRALDADGEWHGEFNFQNRRGEALETEVRATLIRDDDGRPKARLCIATDVTEHKRLEERFLRTQRLESIGMLAAGIAHDLNNILSPILMGAPILRERTRDPGDLQLLSMFEKSAERGAGLVRQILGFAHGVGGEPQPLQVRHVLRDLVAMLHETFPKNIRCEERLARELWMIQGNPTKIHQVLLNLCVNARDAMPQGGVLRLRAENLLLDATAARHLPGGRPGAWVVLHVEDTGTGMTPAILARIWEPFFTTKGAGKGTGIGLVTVRGIVETHQGFVTVQSQPGAGTVFRVYLPASDSLPGAPPPTVSADAPRGLGELVLVVDDEVNIRNVTATTLARYGYRVLTARDGTDALALFTPHRQEIRLVITDVNMPRLDGAAIAVVFRRLNPTVKILAASGAPPGPAAHQPPPYADAFLGKPFTAEILLAAVHRLLRLPPLPASSGPAR